MHRMAAAREEDRGFSGSVPFCLEPVFPDYAILCFKSSLQHHLSPSICLTTEGLQATGTLQPAVHEVCCLGVTSCVNRDATGTSELANLYGNTALKSQISDTEISP